MNLACKIIYPIKTLDIDVAGIEDMILAFNNSFYASKHFTSELINIFASVDKTKSFHLIRYKSEVKVNELIKNNQDKISPTRFRGSVKFFGNIRFYEPGWQDQKQAG